MDLLLIPRSLLPLSPLAPHPAEAPRVVFARLPFGWLRAIVAELESAFGRLLSNSYRVYVFFAYPVASS